MTTFPSEISILMSRHLETELTRAFQVYARCEMELSGFGQYPVNRLSTELLTVVELKEASSSFYLGLSSSFDSMRNLADRIYKDIPNKDERLLEQTSGEMANTIFGLIKSKLNEHKKRFTMGFPSVHNRKPLAEISADVKAYVFSFSGDPGEFDVIVFEKLKN